MQSKTVYLAAGRSLVHLQQLEASGGLPMTSTIDNGFDAGIGVRKHVARSIAIGIAHSPNPIEIMQWLTDGDHVVDYGMVCIAAAKDANIQLLQELYINYDDDIYLCPVFLLSWFSGHRESQITPEVRQWMVDCKNTLDQNSRYLTERYITYREGDPEWKRQAAAAIKMMEELDDDMDLTDDEKWYEDIGYYYSRYRGVIFHD